ncbi:MAG: M14-type cytosolic carboxypeptidase [Myxococcota bacterium]
MHIFSNFDSGNIEVVRDGITRVELAIRKDAGEDHYQWFHFAVAGREPKTLAITNAAGASYTGGWKDYRACASHDREHWFRVPTRYQNGVLEIDHAPKADLTWYAYFAPYSYERHQRLIGEAQQAEGVSYECLGETVDGRPLDMLAVGEGETPLWIIARQHPGESMAEWLVEGLLERLLDESDGLSRTLRKEARFYIVPNMNPDGASRGHLRNNAAGANLNREWAEPSVARSPEVFHTLAAMDRLGLRFCLDVHGDEALPYNFIAGSFGVADLSPKLVELHDRYCLRLEEACPDFQREHGYPRAAPGKANMKMATNQLAGRFQALAMTLEQPFKDSHLPRPEGWSPERCKTLGRAQLDALQAVMTEL